jgi:Zn-dependent peptidase ImmA (M78 family)
MQGGNLIPVDWVDQITTQGLETDGMAFYSDTKIQLKKNMGSDSYKEYVFLHELTHQILNTISSPMRSNERFVSAFASALHQALKTMEYEEGGES